MSHYRDYRGPSYPPRKRPRDNLYEGDRDRGYSRPRQQSLDETVLIRIRKDFISLADPKSDRQATVADDVDYVSRSVVSEYLRTESIKSGVHELLFHCIVELPPKIPYYASVFVVANARKQVIGKDVLEFAVGKVKELIEEGNLVSGKLMLRFLAGLSRIVEGQGVMDVIGEIVSKIEGQEPNARTDNLARMVLLTLPYIAVSPKNPTEALDSIVERLTTYMDSRDTNETSYITPFTTPNEDPLGDFSALHLLWLQTKTLKENQWEIPFLPRPWFAFRTELETNTKTHPMPDFTLDLSSTVLPPLEPEYHFSIFLTHEKQTVPQLSNIASSLFRDIISDTITLLPFNRKESSRLLIDLPQYFPTGLFHRSSIPVADLPPANPARPKYKLEDTIVDVLFAELFRLPMPRQREIYYAALLTDITMLAPQDMAPTLGRGIRWVYQRLEGMRGEIGGRFSGWFAVHLSNFGFTYKWDEWVGDLALEENHPKKVFLRETIGREVRLSYLERIQRTLPEEYFDVFPEKADIEDWIAVTKRLGIEHVETEKIIEGIKSRDENLRTAELDSIPLDIKGKCLLAAILFVSRETPYSHPIPGQMVDFIKEYTTPSVLFDTIMGFWKQRSSTAIVLIMKYADLLEIPLSEVLLWILRQDGWMSRAWGWETIQACLEKVDGRKQGKAEQTNGPQEAIEKNGGTQGTGAEEMQVDRNGENGDERKEMLRVIVSNVGECYSRQSEMDKYWVKEWFAMVVRKFSYDVDEVDTTETTDWVAETINAAKEYRARLS